MWLLLLGCAYLAMSLLTFIVFWRDKQAAARGTWRTRESTMHLLELLGGWPGALIAQRLLRHKSSKVGYRAVLWCSIVAHLAAWAIAAFISRA